MPQGDNIIICKHDNIRVREYMYISTGSVYHDMLLHAMLYTTASIYDI